MFSECHETPASCIKISVHSLSRVCLLLTVSWEGATCQTAEFSPQFCAFSSVPLVCGSRMWDLMPRHCKKKVNTTYECFFLVSDVKIAHLVDIWCHISHQAFASIMAIFVNGAPPSPNGCSCLFGATFWAHWPPWWCFRRDLGITWAIELVLMPFMLANTPFWPMAW